MSNNAKSGTVSGEKPDLRPIDERLVPPFIDGIAPGAGLPVKRVQEGYDCRIDAYPGMAVGQEVGPYIHYVGHGTFIGNSRIITEDNLGADLNFRVGGYLAPIRNGSVELYFVVIHSDGSQTESTRRTYPIID